MAMMMMEGLEVGTYKIEAFFLESGAVLVDCLRCQRRNQVVSVLLRTKPAGTSTLPTLTRVTYSAAVEAKCRTRSPAMKPASQNHSLRSGRDRNTTLPHSEAVTRPDEESPTAVTEHERHHRLLHRHRKAGQVEEDMYAGLNVHDNPEAIPEQEEERRKDGKIKRVLHKISCGGV
ncbi:unnamed protein product [Tuber aestivum]|uniref:Uncharacterized protein n=1 Tax=Tuber aestivum TaxID=59557 RepID=A0A292PYD8_9PEZI|nr:unnamed protein product [Tuber aestivum]